MSSTEPGWDGHGSSTCSKLFLDPLTPKTYLVTATQQNEGNQSKINVSKVKFLDVGKIILDYLEMTEYRSDQPFCRPDPGFG